MFRFVVHRLRWLARIPGFPQFFDAALLVWTALWHRPRLAAMEALEAAMSQMPGIQLGVHRLGGIEFHLGGSEIAHLHGNGLLDVLLNRQQRDAVISNGHAQPHHMFPNSTWVSFWLRDSSDVAGALSLLTSATEIRNAATTSKH